MARLPRGGGARVIDVGCGDGRHIVEAAGRGCYAVGVDYDAVELRKARARAGEHRVDFIVGDATRLPFRDTAFDAVICTETLEHLPDDGAAIAEIARLLTPGGTLLGAVPSHFTEMVYWRLSRGYSRTPGGHVRIYRPRAMAGLLRGAGMQIDDVRYVHFIDSVVWLRFCLTDFLRRKPPPATEYEAAILLAVASERPVATWRTALRHAINRSRLIAAIDALGALVWPKSFAFVATKRAGAEEIEVAAEAATGALR